MRGTTKSMWEISTTDYHLRSRCFLKGRQALSMVLLAASAILSINRAVFGQCLSHMVKTVGRYASSMELHLSSRTTISLFAR